jgi:hypothetical protein
MEVQMGGIFYVEMLSRKTSNNNSVPWQIADAAPLFRQSKPRGKAATLTI